MRFAVWMAVLMTTVSRTLTAIWAGAVFMVYAIARGQGVNMPSFFGYMLWSGAVLVPIFALAGFIFFA